MLEKTRVYRANEGLRAQMKTTGVRPWHDTERLVVSEGKLICTLHYPLLAEDRQVFLEAVAVIATGRNEKDAAPSAAGTTMEAM